MDVSNFLRALGRSFLRSKISSTDQLLDRKLLPLKQGAQCRSQRSELKRLPDEREGTQVGR